MGLITNLTNPINLCSRKAPIKMLRSMMRPPMIKGRHWQRIVVPLERVRMRCCRRRHPRNEGEKVNSCIEFANGAKQRLRKLKELEPIGLQTTDPQQSTRDANFLAAYPNCFWHFRLVLAVC